MSAIAVCILELQQKLKPAYTVPNVEAAHDHLHVERVAAMGPRIQGIQGLTGSLHFKPAEFTVASWLHNLDRSEVFKERIASEGIETVCYSLLKDFPFPFNDMAKDRIIDAVKQHSKKDDEPNDSDLLQALRIADKLDRFSASCLIGVGSSLSHLQMYDPQNPFGYGSTREKDLPNSYKALFRVVEWYDMLPSDEARLLGFKGMRRFVSFIRWFGEEIAGHLGVPNEVEKDLKKALGPHYEQFQK